MFDSNFLQNDFFYKPGGSKRLRGTHEACACTVVHPKALFGLVKIDPLWRGLTEQALKEDYC